MEIWLEIRNDMESGARRLVAEYGDRLLAAAIPLCRNDSDAEELVFRTFDQAIRKIGRYKETGEFYNWLYTIMINFRRMDLRKRRVDLIPVGDSLDLPELPDPFFANLAEEAGLGALRDAVCSISDPLRYVVQRRYFDDASVEEISREIGVPVGTVKSRLFKAREVLHGLLDRK
jgi:RNA polymerase sigma-70 factor, ECF subfamily